MLTLNPPKVQEQIVFTASTNNSNAPLTEHSNAISNNAMSSAKVSSEGTLPPSAMPASIPPPTFTMPMRNVHRVRHREQHKRAKKSTPNDPAVPSDFANLINTEKLKENADTQSLFSSKAGTDKQKPHKDGKKSESDRSSTESESESETSESETESESGSDSSSSESESSDDDGRHKTENGSAKGSCGSFMPSTQMLTEKAKVLARLGRRQRLNPNVTIEYNHNMSLEELLTIDYQMGYQSQSEMSIQFMKRCIVFLVSFSECACKRYPALGLDLEGWGQYMFQRMSQYDELLFDIHDQYASTLTINPIARLTLELVTNAWMYSSARTLMMQASKVQASTIEQLSRLQEALAQAARQKQEEATKQANTPSPKTSPPPHTTTGKTESNVSANPAINPSAMPPPNTHGDAAKLFRLLADQKTQQPGTPAPPEDTDTAIHSKHQKG